eukprot:2018151-Rhodomonas_salina.1
MRHHSHVTSREVSKRAWCERPREEEEMEGGVEESAMRALRLKREGKTHGRGHPGRERKRRGSPR